MQAKDVVVRLATLDGVWEAVGVDRLRGVWAENVSLTSDEFGSSKASCDLKRWPGAIFPDIGAFTPAEFEVGGVRVWSGRVKETPVLEANQTVNLQFEGWQYHLDDDCYARAYVKASVADWRDVRTFASAPLGQGAGHYPAAFQVATDRGIATLTFPAGAAVGQFEDVGIMLDLGPASPGAISVAYDWDSSNNDASSTLFVFMGNAEAPQSGTSQAVSSFNLGSGATGANTTGFTAGGFAARYVAFVLQRQGVATTLAADVWIRLKGIRVFTGAYNSAGVSIVKATDIIPDALDRATILLSSDRSQIDPAGTVTFAFPEFAMDGQHTPREVLAACNAVHDYTLKVDVDKRLVFMPKTASPRVEIGAWPGSEFDDASANSGDEIYNRVIVEGTGPDGTKLSVERSQAQQAGVIFEAVSSPAPDNPSFAVNAATWTQSSPTTFARTTTAGLFDTAPAGGIWGNLSLGLGDTLIETFTGTFQAGVTYLLTVHIDYQAPTQGTPTLDVAFGAGADVSHARWTPAGFAVQSLAWTPNATYPSGVTLKFTAVVGRPSTWLIDTLALAVARPTLVDRRSFRRTHILPISNSLTPELGKQIGDVWLAAHKTTPLKGTVKITGDRATRDILTGASVPPERLLTMTGELLRLSHRIDPDDGSAGRDGRIAEVTYVPKDDAATVAIDSRRTSQEALLARMAIVIGNG